MGEQAGGACAARTVRSAAILLGAWAALVGCGRKPLAHPPRLGRSRPRSSSLTTGSFLRRTRKKYGRRPDADGALLFSATRNPVETWNEVAHENKTGRGSCLGR